MHDLKEHKYGGVVNGFVLCVLEHQEQVIRQAQRRWIAKGYPCNMFWLLRSESDACDSAGDEPTELGGGPLQAQLGSGLV